MITPLRRLAPFVAGGTALQITRWADASLISMIVVLLTGARSDSVPPAIVATLAVTLLMPVPIGVLVDRSSRRSTLVWSGAVGAVALGSLAAATLAGMITTAHLTLAVGAAALMSITGSLAQESYLPAVTGKSRFAPVNAVLYGVASAGMLVASSGSEQARGPMAAAVLAVPAAGFLVSALLFRTVNAAEEPAPRKTGPWREAMAGIRFTLDHPALWPIIRYFMVLAMLQPLIGRAGELFDGVAGGWEAPVMLAAALAGALAAVLLGRRVGALLLAGVAVLVTQPFALLLAFPSGPAGYVLGQVLPWAGAATAAVTLLSHRQAITPPRLLGRSGGLLLTLTAVGVFAGPLLESLARTVATMGGDLRFWLVVPATAGVLAAAYPLVRVSRSEPDYEAERKLLAPGTG